MRVSETEILRSLCRKSFADFCKEFWSTVVAEELRWNWHMTVICDELQEVAERIFRGEKKKYDLVINVSPGASKSTIASIMFPAWCWTRMPSFRYIGASYSYHLALDHSRKNRDVVKSDLYRETFGVEIRNDQDTKGYFVNKKGGQRYTTSSNGTVTGMHGHYIGIDDPLDPNEALSELIMYQTNTWIRETLSSRKVDRSITPMVLIMQRLHQDDPTQLFLERKNVRHVCIPAEETDKVSPPELRKFYKEKLFDPKRFPKDVLEEAAREMGPYGYSGQYLQDPVPRAGGMFDTSKLKYATPSQLVKVVRYWDKAGTAGKVKKGRGAYTVGVKMGIDDANRIFILDVIRVRMDAYEREKLICDTADWTDSSETIIAVEQEGGSGGKESAEGTLRNLAGYNVVIDLPKGDKETRADPLSVQVNAGNVHLVPSDWNADYVEEMRNFPFSTTKDQIDASSGALAMLITKRKRRVGAMQPKGGNKRTDGMGRSRAGKRVYGIS